MEAAEFEFLVRRPLKCKEGALWESKGGMQVKVSAVARWPSFTLNGEECRVLKTGVVHRKQDKDKALGVRLYMKCVSIQKMSGNAVYFAA